MVKPTKLFWKARKHVLRYLKGTFEYGLWYRQTDEVKWLHGCKLGRQPNRQKEHIRRDF